MAYSLQQRFNIRNRLGLNDSVAFVDKCYEAIRKVAQDSIDGDFTLSDATTLSPGFNVNQAQFNQYALRSATGLADNYLIPMILDKNNLPANPDDATDLQIVVSVKRCCAPMANMIGNGW